MTGTLGDIRAVVCSAGETPAFTARPNDDEHTKKGVGLWGQVWDRRTLLSGLHTLGRKRTAEWPRCRSRLRS